MWQWILFAVAVIAAYCVGFFKGDKHRLKDLEYEWEKHDEDREEHERELEEKENELKDKLKRLASQCFLKFYTTYIAFEVGRTESVRKAVRDTFGIFFLERVTMDMEDEEFLDFLREEHPDEFKGLKVKVPSTKEMFFGDFEVE